MMFTSLFNDTMFDEIMNARSARSVTTSMMATDVKEYDAGYELEIELPGVKKENVQARLKNGYLTVSAEYKDEATDDGSKYIRRERRTGTCTRSFYVGEALTQDDIKAKFEDGILKIAVPKETAHPEIENRNLISIE